MLRTFKQAPVSWAFLDRMLYVNCDACCDWKVELVSVRHVFEVRQNLASALYSCLSGSDASARSSQRVSSRVPFSWMKFRIKLSGRAILKFHLGAWCTRIASDPRSFRDRCRLGLRRTREKTSHARLTSHRPLTCSRSRVSYVHIRDSRE